MSNEEHPPHGKDSDLPPGGDAPFGSIEDLDAHLSQAADAAEDLVRNSGAVDPRGNDPVGPLETTNVTPPTDVVAQELTHLEGLVSTVAAELGVEAPNDPAMRGVSIAPSAVTEAGAAEVRGVRATTSAVEELDSLLAGGSSDAIEASAPLEPAPASAIERDAPLPPNVPKPSASTAEAVPDFMREFMEPSDEDGGASDGSGPVIGQKPSDHENAKREASGVKYRASGKPGVVGTGMLGVVGHVSEDSLNDPEHPAANPVGSDAVGAGAGGTAGELRSGGSLSRQVLVMVDRLAPFAYRALLGVAFVLERMDGSFGWLGPRVRELLGFVALATLGTAGVVYVMALF